MKNVNFLFLNAEYVNNLATVSLNSGAIFGLGVYFLAAESNIIGHIVGLLLVAFSFMLYAVNGYDAYFKAHPYIFDANKGVLLRMFAFVLIGVLFVVCVLIMSYAAAKVALELHAGLQSG